MKNNNFTEGSVLKSLLSFSIPVLFSMFLQAMYSAVDIAVVGRFSDTANLSGVTTGSQLLTMITITVTSMSMGITVAVAEAVGAKRKDDAGRVIGTGIVFFAIIAGLLTLLSVPFSDALSNVMHAPKEAFSQTSSYVRICGGGMIFIVAYNVLGAIFRGLGDSKTPLITVSIACVVNIFGDLLLCGVFDLGASGAAWATITAQCVSVVISIVLIKKRGSEIAVQKSFIKLNSFFTRKIIKIGFPIMLQDLLVSFSFLFIQIIVNDRGIVESASVGIADKVCAFLMLAASAYMQSISAFVAQNNGAGKPDRSKHALFYGIATSFAISIVLSLTSFFLGGKLSALFTSDAAVITSAHQYLKGYSIDCLLTAVLFCFVGYFNGCERTIFVMVQGIVGSFCVRIPVVLFMSRLSGSTLFHIALGSPISSAVQIVMCLVYFAVIANKGEKKQKTTTSPLVSKKIDLNDVKNAIEICNKIIVERKRGIKGCETISQIEDFVLPELKNLLNHEDAPYFFNGHPFLISYAKAFRSWEWDYNSDLLKLLKTINNSYENYCKSYRN